MVNLPLKKADILKALEWIDLHGTPPRRVSRKYHLKNDNKFYSPKFVISKASELALGKELEANEFYGGEESNGFLRDLGFEIVTDRTNAGAIVAKDKIVTDDLLLKKTNSAKNKSLPIDKLKSKKFEPSVDPIKSSTKDKTIKNAKQALNPFGGTTRIATVLIQSNETYTNKSRATLVSKTIDLCEDVDLLIFPGGTFQNEKITEKTIKEIGDKIIKAVGNKDIIVCLGIDSTSGKDQIGLAVSKTGIKAVGRKFHPAPGEEFMLKKAKNENEKEFGFDRTFQFKGHKGFLAVCYDSFGIKHKKLTNQGTSIIVDLIHAFYPVGQGGSGEVYFAKHGLAGAAKEWNCPAFGAAVFFNRQIPINWQSGVIWNMGTMSTQKWKYDDNGLKAIEAITYDFGNEKVEVRVFAI